MRTGGYFSREADANFIVMPVSRDDYALQTIFHEYTHYFVARNVRTTVPGWVSEGIAEFYSTFRGDFRGKTLIGGVPTSRARILRSSTFVPLRDIVSPRDLESMWRWEKQIGMFYAESWALACWPSFGADAALKLAEQAEIQEWTRSVLRYLQGRLDEAQFLRAASDIGEETEAHTYIGFKLSLAGKDDQAVAHFRWVVERGAKTYLEYDLARND